MLFPHLISLASLDATPYSYARLSHAFDSHFSRPSKGRTSFDVRQYYMAYDVTALIKPGEKNCIGLLSAAGWQSKNACSLHLPARDIPLSPTSHSPPAPPLTPIDTPRQANKTIICVSAFCVFFYVGMPSHTLSAKALLSISSGTTNDHGGSTKKFVATATTWTGSVNGPITAASIYLGEKYDATKEVSINTLYYQ
jgi:hypothetical protein